MIRLSAHINSISARARKRERERETEKQTDRQRQTETERDRRREDPTCIKAALTLFLATAQCLCTSTFNVLGQGIPGCAIPTPTTIAAPSTTTAAPSTTTAAPTTTPGKSLSVYPFKGTSPLSHYVCPPGKRDHSKTTRMKHFLLKWSVDFIANVDPEFPDCRTAGSGALNIGKYFTSFVAHRGLFGVRHSRYKLMSPEYQKKTTTKNKKAAVDARPALTLNSVFYIRCH